jgi:spore coat polysaccharide biosynthesis protein SpsF
MKWRAVRSVDHPTMMKPRIIAIIQARMASSRLPGKVLLDIAGRPMLAHVVLRTRQAKTVDQVVVATTIEADDDPVAVYCARQGYLCYRGSQHDVLDRYYQAARIFGAEVVVRITADCPLIDPTVIDKTVLAFLGQEPKAEAFPDVTDADGFPYDFAANRLPPPWGRTYPIGLDTEVCTFSALERAWKEADQPYQREHVMPYLYEQQGRFRVRMVNHEVDYGDLRWTVDTAEDLKLVRKLFAHFPGREDFSWLEVLEVFEREANLRQINAQVHHKNVHDVDPRGGSQA